MDIAPAFGYYPASTDRPPPQKGARVSDPVTILDTLEDSLGDAALIISEVAGQLDNPDLALAYRARLFDLQQTYAYMVSAMDQAIIRLHPYDPERGPMLLPGGGSVKIQGGTVPKRYDIPALESALCHGIAARYEGWRGVTPDGEPVDIEELASDIVRQTVNAAGADAPSFTNFRKTVFKTYGVDITRYMIDSEKSPLKVVVYGRDKEGT